MATESDFKIRAKAIAVKIQFTRTMHLAAEKCHSHRYTNSVLGIGCEVHVHGSSRGGYFEPSKRKKPTKAFYLESEKDTFDTLEELLVRYPLVLQKAEKKLEHNEGDLK